MCSQPSSVQLMATYFKWWSDAMGYSWGFGFHSSGISLQQSYMILLSLALFRAPLCLRSSWCYICIKNFFCLHPSLYLLVRWAWCDWPLTWLTNHHPSVLWHCWLGHVTRKIVSEMTYNVSSGTLNTTIPYPQAVHASASPFTVTLNVDSNTFCGRWRQTFDQQ